MADFSQLVNKAGNFLKDSFSTKKAILCMVNPAVANSYNTYTNGPTKEEKKVKLTELAEKANEKEKQLLDSAGKALDNSMKDFKKHFPKEFTTPETFVEFEVQYNPNSLRFEATAGEQVYIQNTQKSAYADELKKINSKTTISLDFQLVFDDLQIGDAFALETGSLISNTAVEKVQDITKMVQGKSTKRTIQPQMDMLVAAIARASTRHVIFFWSNMSFRGEMTIANARYTMFNTKGNPIRGTIDCRIVQIADIEEYKYDDSYWNKKFEKVFKEGPSVAASGKDAQTLMKEAQKATKMSSNNFFNNNFISF
jgi:hypothetical protein